MWTVILKKFPVNLKMEVIILGIGINQVQTQCSLLLPRKSLKLVSWYVHILYKLNDFNLHYEIFVEGHLVIPDGYNLGRNWIAGNATGSSIENPTNKTSKSGQTTGYWTLNGDSNTNQSWAYETEVTCKQCSRNHPFIFLF